jgi:FtsP/CotA-like multicopper oxidase with cupredoxin domain
MRRITRGGRGRLAAASAVTALIVGPLAWLWQASLLPDTYSVMDMGYPDTGRSEDGPHALHAMGGTSIDTLIADPDRPADVALTLTARRQRLRLPSGRTVDGFTLDDASPGPTIRATAGQLVQVRLVNESVPEGITLHWHGVDVPNAVDGVAGVTQDAVAVGADHTYRFVAHQAGTFWYHSHQVSHEQVRGGLFGALVIAPATHLPAGPPTADVVALAHLYAGVRTVNAVEGDVRVAVAPGGRARVRVINTDNGPMSVWVAGTPYRLVAVDGTDLHRPSAVADAAVLVTAGGRADVEVTMPQDGTPVRVHLGGATGIVLGSPSTAPAPVPQPRRTLDLLSYGEGAPLGFDPDAPTRRFEYAIGRRPGFIDGRPGLFWTIDGHLFPDVPMFMVRRGDVVRMHLSNHSGEVHPMHLHGHHAVVVSRNGVRASGSPWWVDSLNVGDGESYEIAFVADNPGIWMDHCHNLPHAGEGLVAHLAYEGITTPYSVGGRAANRPE